jgi:hypothetical protein
MLHRWLAFFINRLGLQRWWKDRHKKSMLRRLEKQQPLSVWQLAFAFHNCYLTVSRFFFYYNWLLQHSYEQVFFTDVNDVVFQENVFREQQQGVVQAFEECDRVKLGTDPNNSGWIAAGFAPEVLQDMEQAVIYCAGTILSDKSTGIAFLRDFCRELLNGSKPLDMNGFDQGVYNYMVSYAKRPYFSSSANGALVFTVATHPPAEILIRNGKIVAKEMEAVPAVIHQYNRHKKLVDFITEEYLEYQGQMSATLENDFARSV